MPLPVPVLPCTIENAAPPTDFCRSTPEPTHTVVPLAKTHSGSGGVDVGVGPASVRLTKLVPPLVETARPPKVAA